MLYKRAEACPKYYNPKLDSSLGHRVLQTPLTVENTYYNVVKTDLICSIFIILSLIIYLCFNSKKQKL